MTEPIVRAPLRIRSGCDSFDRPHLTWRPLGDPQATLRVLAAQGWTSMDLGAQRGYGATSVGFSRVVHEGTIEVVLTQRPSVSFQAILD